jgi:hypothetical protein
MVERVTHDGDAADVRMVLSPVLHRITVLRVRVRSPAHTNDVEYAFRTIGVVDGAAFQGRRELIRQRLKCLGEEPLQFVIVCEDALGALRRTKLPDRSAPVSRHHATDITHFAQVLREPLGILLRSEYEQNFSQFHLDSVGGVRAAASAVDNVQLGGTSSDAGPGGGSLANY